MARDITNSISTTAPLGLEPIPYAGREWNEIHHILRRIFGLTYEAAVVAIESYRKAADAKQPSEDTLGVSPMAFVAAAHVYDWFTQELPRRSLRHVLYHERRAWRELARYREAIKTAEQIDSDEAIRKARERYTHAEVRWHALHLLREDIEQGDRPEEGDNQCDSPAPRQPAPGPR